MTKRITFESATRWLGELKQYAEKDCVIALVGNKVDLADKNSRRREVSYEEGKLMAQENKLLFFETSALSSFKVNDCFEDLLQEIYNERRKITNRNRAYNNIVTLGVKDKAKLTSNKCC